MAETVRMGQAAAVAVPVRLAAKAATAAKVS